METMELERKMIQLSKESKLELLTLDHIEDLKGKRIQTIAFGYADQFYVDDFIVGGLMSEYDRAKNEQNSPEGWNNRAEYWESYMSEDRLLEAKTNIGLMRENGTHTFINAHGFNDGLFTCSDADRYVSFRVVEDA